LEVPVYQFEVGIHTYQIVGNVVGTYVRKDI
jgi:hypothetical protein